MEIVLHTCVRGVVIDAGKVLVHFEEGGPSFFPGGHLEQGELLEAALKREFKEELGLADITVLGYLGVIEKTLEKDGVLHHVLNHFFRVKADDLRADVTPQALEQGYGFYWCDVTELEARGVYPEPVRTLVPNLVQGDESIWYASVQGNQVAVR